MTAALLTDPELLAIAGAALVLYALAIIFYRSQGRDDSRGEVDRMLELIERTDANRAEARERRERKR